MCWSSTADLVMGSAIAAIGVASVAGAASHGRVRDLPLAALPLLLGAHQLIESVVWAKWDHLPGAAPTGTASMTSATTSAASMSPQLVGGWAVVAWAVIAFPLLPTFVPGVVLLAAGPGHRARLVPFAVVGLATSAVFAYALASGPITAEAVGHTMHYGVHDLRLAWLVSIAYLVAALGALLASDRTDVRLLGVVGGVGAPACYLLWHYAFASTWCALAAAASLVLLRWSWSRERGGIRAQRHKVTA
jgi:hypothetical protein